MEVVGDVLVDDGVAGICKGTTVGQLVSRSVSYFYHRTPQLNNTQR